MPERVEIAGLSVQASSRGMPVVLVHAFPVDSNLYAYQLGADFEGFRLLCPDLPGFGETPAREIGSLDNYADLVLSVCDAEGADRFVVGGTSMGGYVAFAVLRKAADRVAGLVLADTKAEADTEEARAGREEMAKKAEDEGSAAVADALLPRLLTPKTHTSQPDVAERVRRMGANADPSGVAAALRAMATRPDSTDLLAEIRVPTLVVVGASDEITPPPLAEAMAEAIPDARLEVIPDAGHLTPIETPVPFNEALREFLTELS